MKAVFFGSGEFAVPILTAIGNDVRLVVSQAAKPSGRGMRFAPSPVEAEARRLGLAVETPQSARDQAFVSLLDDLAPELFVVASYGQILSQRLLDVARKGAFNLHGSILPRYRGAAPIQRCLEQGDTETGVTMIKMDKGMDTGDIVATTTTPIQPEETYGDLQGRLAIMAAQLTTEWLPKLFAGSYDLHAQDHSHATFAPKVERSETQLYLDDDGKTQHNKYRAFTPNPGAFLITRFGRMRVWRSNWDRRVDSPGTLIDVETVAFRGSSLKMLEVQMEGKKRMPFREFANGQRLKPGDTLL